MKTNSPENLQKPGRPFASAASRFTLYGAIFGLLFPVVATLIRIAILRLPYSTSGMITAQQSDPLLWIIDTAPLFLGIFAFLAGSRQDKLQRANQELEFRTDELDRVRVTLEQRVEERTLELEKA